MYNDIQHLLTVNVGFVHLIFVIVVIIALGITIMGLKAVLTALSIALSSSIGLTHNDTDNGYNTTANLGFRAGNSQVEGFVDFIVPLWRQDNNHLFFNPRFLLADEGNNQFNLGIGFRHLFDNRGILGANLYFDSRESNLGFRYKQFGTGLEWLGNKFDARINAYEAQDEVELANSFATTETQINRSVSTNRSSTTSVNRFGIETPTAAGNSVSQNVQTDISTTTITNRTTTTRRTTTNRTFEQFEGALDGWDAEVGFKLPFKKGPEIRLFGGYYSYENPFEGDDISGAKARLEIRSGQYLSFDFELYENSFDQSEPGNDYFVGARLEVPLTGKNTWKNVLKNLFGNPNRSLEDRLHHEMVIRDVRIHTQISDPQENESLRSQTVAESSNTKTATETVTNSSTGTETLAENLFFVDDDNTGTQTGTVENPYRTVADAVAAAPTNTTVFVCEFGGGVCDLGGGGGTYNETTGVTLKSGQTITSTIAGVGGSAGFTTQNRPIITNSAQATNTGVINTALGGNTINRLNIQARNSSNRNGIQNNNNTGTVDIINSQISTSARNSNAIRNNNTTGNINITNSTLITTGVAPTGQAVTSNAVFNDATTGNVSITNSILSTAGLSSDGVRNRDTNGSITFSNNTFTSTGRNGRAVFNLRTNGLVTVNNNTITTNGLLAEGIQNRESTGLINISNNTITTSGDGSTGIFNQRNTGAIAITNNTIMTDGINSEGIDNSRTRENVTITGNTITTLGTGGSHAVNNRNTESQVTISNNTLNTNQTSAFGVQNNNTGAGSIDINNNTICVVAGGTHVNISGTSSVTQSGNTQITQATCP